MVQPDGKSQEYEKNKWATNLILLADKQHIPLLPAFKNGIRYLSKDFFSLLMFFYLQYYYMFDGIINGAGEGKPPKFPGIKIITQGYDYVIPSHKKDFGLNPLRWYVPFIRNFLGHGHWIKTPLQIRGITDPKTQEDILYTMVYLFNEMMINLGTCFNSKEVTNVFHIDSRESVGRNGWTDELHPKPAHFMKTGNVFVDCIRQKRNPTYQHVYVVNNFKL